MAVYDRRGTEARPDSALRAAIAAEAAVWIARLHGPDRSSAMVRECLEWQAKSAAHRHAFERCTDVWESVREVRLADAFASASAAPRMSTFRSPGFGPARWAQSAWGLATALSLVLLGSGAFLYWPLEGKVYDTQVGEQQLVVLEDGTRLSLNTQTRVRVQIDASLRRVSVLGGEALFEVAKDASRPFVVQAAGSEVLAVGTVFSVRLGDSQAAASDALAVTLLEGQVTVRPAMAGRPGVTPPEPMLMQAGERIRLAKAQGLPGERVALRVDRPRIEQMVAWRRNEVVFDNVSLGDAVSEMNRYHRVPIVLHGSEAVAQLRISGLYRTGDSAGFARAIAALHGLSLKEQGGRLDLLAPR